VSKSTFSTKRTVSRILLTQIYDEFFVLLLNKCILSDL
ncbi:MAG: hypothetical protein ACI9J3_001984, partial [Parvicellaceae bacterium]